MAKDSVELRPELSEESKESKLKNSKTKKNKETKEESKTEKKINSSFHLHISKSKPLDTIPEETAPS